MIRSKIWITFCLIVDPNIDEIDTKLTGYYIRWAFLIEHIQISFSNNLF